MVIVSFLALFPRSLITLPVVADVEVVVIVVDVDVVVVVVIVVVTP